MPCLISACSFHCTEVKIHHKSSLTKATVAVHGAEISPATKLLLGDFLSQSGGSCRGATTRSQVTAGSSGRGDS